MPPKRNKMVIAHVISALGRGGMENAVARLALQQKKSGHNVHVVCIRDMGPTAEILQNGNVPVHFCPFRSRLDPISINRLRILFGKLGVNVVQTHNYRPNVSGTVAGRLARVPAVISSLRTVNRWDTIRQFWIDRLLCFWRDAIVCVSEEVKEKYLEKIKWCRKKCHVIHNGIDLQKFRGVNKAIYLYEKYGLPPDAIYLISIARLVKIKDHSTLLMAFRKIVNKNEHVHLLLLGEGSLRGDLERRTSELQLEGRVHFLSHQDNVDEWLSIAQISVLSTHTEGFSSTILESMAAKIPVIATAVGGNLEAIQDGVTGYLTPPGNADAIAEKALYLIRNPQMAKSMGDCAAKVVEEKFTIEATAGKTLELYQNILSRKGYKIESP